MFKKKFGKGPSKGGKAGGEYNEKKDGVGESAHESKKGKSSYPKSGKMSAGKAGKVGPLAFHKARKASAKMHEDNSVKDY